MRDLIDRQDAIDALRKLSQDDGYINLPHEYVTDVVRGLPSARQERKTGTDISDTVVGHYEFKCSLCGADARVVEGGSLDGGRFNYCPYCGAKMGCEDNG